MEYEYVGIDIAKNKFDVYFQGKSWTVKQTPSNIKKELIGRLLKETQSLDKILVVMEASGGYERLLSTFLAKENIKFHIAHAQFIKAFAQSDGLKAKTDKIDAKNIATFAQERQVKPDKVLSKNKQEIADLLKRRDQLVADKVREKKRLDKHHEAHVKTSIRKHMDWIDSEISDLNKAIDKIVKTDKDIQQQMAILTSVPGVGRIIALHTLVFFPEVGDVSNKQASALIGVAPYSQDSGKYHGRRFIRGGRARMRGLFYMAAVTSIKCNPEMKIFYKRLQEKGKATRVALIAVARKIICMLNSIVMRGTPWVEKEQFTCQN